MPTQMILKATRTLAQDGLYHRSNYTRKHDKTSKRNYVLNNLWGNRDDMENAKKNDEQDSQMSMLSLVSGGTILAIHLTS